MANIDNTKLTSDNAERFDEITQNLTFKNEHYIDREPGVIFVRTAWGIPHEKIKELSGNYPDMTFHAEYSFESVMWDTIHHVQYKAGEDEVMNLEPNYMHTAIPEHIEKQVSCYEELLEKAMDVFKRVDVVKDDEKGDKFIDWCDADVAVTVEHDGYKMQATKSYSQIEKIQCFKARETTTVDWLPVRDEIDDIPF
jgi:hypothetical protein